MMSAALFGTVAEAAPMVTYTWTTTSEGFGTHVSAPSSATFEVPLSDVLAGEIPQFDISNIELTYPGLSFDSTVTSSIGSDNAAFVDPATGSFHLSRRQPGTGGRGLRRNRHQCGDHFPVDPRRQSGFGRRQGSVQRAQCWNGFCRLSHRGFLDRHFSFHGPSRPRSFDMGHDAARLCRAELRELSGVPRSRRGGIRGDSDSLSI